MGKSSGLPSSTTSLVVLHKGPYREGTQTSQEMGWTLLHYNARSKPYRLLNCTTNVEVRSLVNAMRLKPYYDPEDRPTNPPDQLLESQEELDPEELHQTQRNRNEEDRNRNTNVQSRGNTENTRRKDDENKVRRKKGPSSTSSSYPF